MVFRKPRHSKCGYFFLHGCMGRGINWAWFNRRSINWNCSILRRDDEYVIPTRRYSSFKPSDVYDCYFDYYGMESCRLVRIRPLGTTTTRNTLDNQKKIGGQSPAVVVC